MSLMIRCTVYLCFDPELSKKAWTAGWSCNSSEAAGFAK